MAIIFFGSLFLLLYIYCGYLWLLRIIVWVCSLKKAQVSTGGDERTNFLPELTVLITVYNEEDCIQQRINNILKCDYPESKLEIIVASDGSTDKTDELVKNIVDKRVRLFRPQKRFGKTHTQNQAIQEAKGEIIIFTDAGASFDKKFLQNICAPFTGVAVGCVTGHLLFNIDPKSGVSTSQGSYWSYELKLREAESKLGILTVAAGACMAIRRNLFRPMEAAYGEDCIIPLDIVAQNFRVVHASSAIAYDRMEHEATKEFQTRVRMTLRNWQGTWSRSSLLNPFSHPRYAFSLWSHKILRWLSPFFLLLLTMSGLALYEESMWYAYFFAGLLFFYLAGIIGWITEIKNWNLPIVRGIFGFLLANVGFFLGVIRAVKGVSITTYKT